MYKKEKNIMSFIGGNKNGLSIETINKPFEILSFQRNKNTLNYAKRTSLNWTLNGTYFSKV